MDAPTVFRSDLPARAAPPQTPGRERCGEGVPTNGQTPSAKARHGESDDVATLQSLVSARELAHPT